MESGSVDQIVNRWIESIYIGDIGHYLRLLSRCRHRQSHLMRRVNNQQ